MRSPKLKRFRSNAGICAKAMTEVSIVKAEDVWRLFPQFGQTWVFRGQSEKEWGLMTVPLL
jgi:hypothetical protein